MKNVNISLLSWNNVYGMYKINCTLSTERRVIGSEREKKVSEKTTSGRNNGLEDDKNNQEETGKKGKTEGKMECDNVKSWRSKRENRGLKKRASARSSDSEIYFND